MRRSFGSCAVNAFPRAPKRPLLNLSIQSPTPNLLAQKPTRIIRDQPIYHPVPQQIGHRHLPNVKTALPISTQGSVSTQDQVSKEPRFYQITLMRGLIGLPRSTRSIIKALGLTKRHQVVWKPIHPGIAGMILKTKELVSVDLVHDIPKRIPVPLGYHKIGNSIGNWHQGL